MNHGHGRMTPLVTAKPTIKNHNTMNTLKDFLEEYYTGEPYEVAKQHLYELLLDLDMLDAFRGGVWGPDDIMDNLEAKEK